MILLDKTQDTPIYEQIYQALKRDILDGTIPCCTSLTPIRKLANELQVSKNTVDRAYQQLLAEAYVQAVPGSGFFVGKLENNFANTVCAEDITVQPTAQLRYDFRYDAMESEAFPWGKWRKYVQNALIEEENGKAVSYDSNKGNLKLRQALCGYLRQNRGVHCTPEQIVIVPGTQYAIQTLIELLPKRSYRLGFENPGYDAMRKIFTDRGHKIVSVPWLQHGFHISILRKQKCDLCYLTPSHQFPTGQILSLEQRAELLEWADMANAFIIENDYDNEFWYSQRRLPSMQSMDESNRVIYVSTLSKVLSPSIRCAYMVLPKTLLARYDEIYHQYNAALPTFHQVALANFMEDGHLEKHGRTMAVRNSEKCQLVKDLLLKYSDGQIHPTEYISGSHILVKIPKATSQQSVIDHLYTCGIGIYPTAPYWDNLSQAPKDTFLLGYNSMDKKVLMRAVSALIQAIRRYEPEKTLKTTTKMQCCKF